MSNDTQRPTREVERYRGLPRLLHNIRWTQHLLAIVAEVLILLSFAMSGMDISLGGIMANTATVKWAWAVIFSLGVDTSFVISWVRCREYGRSWHLLWSLPVALGISFVVFEPVVIQLLQQALDIGFNQALAVLGINLTVLVYARAAVAVFLGAILAVTNVESQGIEPQPSRPRRIILFEQLLNRVAPVISGQVHAATSAQTVATVDVAALPTGPLPEQVTDQLPASTAESVVAVSTPEQRAAAIRSLDLGTLSAEQRVQAILARFPDISDREMGRLSGLAPATAKKYRAAAPSIHE